MPHKLLLADDSVTIQRVIELTFADEDVQVVAVGDGKKAIASIQADRPDIVLADVGMPERDGYEVAQFIKGNPQLANIPVLLLTGAFEPIDETRARAVGCDGVLVKPFEPQMVINRVKDLLAGRRGGLWGTKPAAPAPVRDVPRAPAPDTNVQAAAPAAAAQSATSASLEDYFDRLDAAFASVEAATEARMGPPVLTPDLPAGAVAHTRSAGSQSALSSGLAAHEFEGWDPDLAGDPMRSGSAPVPAADAIVSQSAAPVAAPAPIAEVQAAPPIVSTLPSAPAPSLSPAPPPTNVSSSPNRPEPVPQTETPVIPFKPTPREPVAAPPATDVSIPVVAAPAKIEPPPSAATMPSPAAASVPIAAIPSLAEAFASLLSAERGRPIAASTVGAQPPISDEKIEEVVRRVVASMADRTIRDTVVDVAERLVREEIDRIKQGQ